MVEPLPKVGPVKGSIVASPAKAVSEVKAKGSGSVNETAQHAVIETSPSLPVLDSAKLAQLTEAKVDGLRRKLDLFVDNIVDKGKKNGLDELPTKNALFTALIASDFYFDVTQELRKIKEGVISIEQFENSNEDTLRRFARELIPTTELLLQRYTEDETRNILENALKSSGMPLDKLTVKRGKSNNSYVDLIIERTK